MQSRIAGWMALIMMFSAFMPQTSSSLSALSESTSLSFRNSSIMSSLGSASDEDSLSETIGGGTTVTSYLNVRPEPDSGSDTIDQLYKGDTFLVLGYSENGAWCRILFQGTVAYVNAYYVLFESRLTSSFLTAGSAVVKDNGTRLREFPEEGGTLAGTCDAGTVLEITGVWKEYLAVRMGDVFGYVLSSEVSFEPSEEWLEPSHLTAADLDVDTEISLTIWNYLKQKGLTDEGAAGLMGNIYAESDMQPTNLENWGNKKLRWTDSEFVSAVNSGAYTKDDFIDDSMGFGLCQWTYFSRKEGLYEYTVERGLSIADLKGQLDYLWYELESYSSVLEMLQTTVSLREAVDGFMCRFEDPANQMSAARRTRLTYAMYFLELFSTEETIAAQEGVSTANAVTASGTLLYARAEMSSRKMILYREETPVTVVQKGEIWSRLDNGLWIRTEDLTSAAGLLQP